MSESMSESVNRRQFLKGSIAGAGGMAALARVSDARKVLAANDTIRVAVVGLRGRGKEHISGFHKQPGVQVAALCDVDESVLRERAGQYETVSGHSVKCYRDMRAVFDDKEIDVVSFATPNHWHSLGGIWAMQAGKHAYIEKPCSHNVWEGRQLVKAAREHNRLCQHGTQGRSSPAIREAIQKLREGVIGDVYMARGLCFKWRPSIGKAGGPQQIPAGVDYDLWCGPAPKKPLLRKNLHYDWHWEWDCGNGDMGNQGVHEMDMARWGLGVGLPDRIQSMGGHFMFDDDQETPNTLIGTQRRGSCCNSKLATGLLTTKAGSDRPEITMWAYCSTVQRVTWSWSTLPTKPIWARRGNPAPKVPGKGIPGRLLSAPSGAGNAKTLASILKRAISRAHCVIWGTLPIALAEPFCLILLPRRSPAMKRPQECSAAIIESPLWFLSRFSRNTSTRNQR